MYFLRDYFYVKIGKFYFKNTPYFKRTRVKESSEKGCHWNIEQLEIIIMFGHLENLFLVNNL